MGDFASEVEIFTVRSFERVAQGLGVFSVTALEFGDQLCQRDDKRAFVASTGACGGLCGVLSAKVFDALMEL